MGHGSLLFSPEPRSSCQDLVPALPQGSLAGNMAELAGSVAGEASLHREGTNICQDTRYLYSLIASSEQAGKVTVLMFRW